MRARLAVLALLAACSAFPTGRSPASAGGGGGSGGTAPGGSGGTGASAPGGSGGTGGSCTQGELPVVYLEALGIQDVPGGVPDEVHPSG